ncbi:hypothetical protein LPJ74_003490 [Coemansia sp. RSA 1843]|nr:hypothetical protein LPJ74_003490 [Coemansia sp. RSA 1843]
MLEGTFRQNLDSLVKHSVEDMWSAVIKCGIVDNVQPPYARGSDDIGDYTDEDTLEEPSDWDEKWKGANWSKCLFLYRFITKPRIYRAATREVRPHGLSIFAGDRFSDGQQQLFGLCRLLMRNRKIVVLDEATANVDLETDQRMQELIHSEFKGCTALTIAHRLETIMNSDRTIVVDNGRVAEIGPPRELLTENGYFAKLVKANDFGQ